jgi:transcriptional pleiotropic regulator of transition state genes
MKSTGIIRPLDKLGRIVIPMELRKSFKLEIGDPIEIYTDEETIILKKHKVGCFKCGEMNNLKDVPNLEIKLCPTCLNKLALALEKEVNKK